MNPTPTTLLLVDCDPSILRGLRMRLALETDLAVVGEASRCDDVVAIADRLSPDIVVLDLDAPAVRAGSLALVRTLAPRHRVVAIGLDDDPASAAAVCRAGAVTYVGKHEATSRLLAAIRSCRAIAGGGEPME